MIAPQCKTTSGAGSVSGGEVSSSQLPCIANNNEDNRQPEMRPSSSPELGSVAMWRGAVVREELGIIAYSTTAQAPGPVPRQVAARHNKPSRRQKRVWSPTGITGCW